MVGSFQIVYVNFPLLLFALRHRAPKMLTQYSLRKKFSQDYKFCDSSIFENFAGIWIHDLQIMQIQFFEYDEN